MTKKYIGAHVSASGGVENAPLNAKAIGANDAGNIAKTYFLTTIVWEKIFNDDTS